MLLNVFRDAMLILLYIIILSIKRDLEDHMYKKSISILKSIFSFAIFELLRLLKLTYLIGSKKIMFSAINVVGPLSGASSSTFGGLLICMIRDSMRFGLSNLGVYHIPTLCASTYWMNSGPIIRLFVPLVCMLLFNLHSIGAAAWTYSLYWLIPVGIYFLFSPKSIIGQAFGSTFVAHAVGSVIWLYTIPMTSTQWLALIPQVALERTIFACGIIMVYYAVESGLKAFNQLTRKTAEFAHK